MFIEVYIIPFEEWTANIENSKIDENRRLIPCRDIRVRYSAVYVNRAEILFPNGDIINVVGSYDEIVDRISRVVSIERLK